MTGHERTDDGNREQGTGKALKRRGILAAAGMAVAGIVAKRTAETQPVAANEQTWQFPYSGTGQTVLPLIALNNGGGGRCINAYSTGYIGITGKGRTYGVEGVATADGIGVYGSSAGDAIKGVSDASNGVVGVTSAAAGSGKAGVSGQGAEAGTFGILGSSTRGIGMQGQIDPGSTAAGTIAVYGVNYSSGANSTGIYGAANSGSGVFGATYGTGLVAGVYGTSTTAYGVLGSTTAPFYSGLTATTNTTNCAALAATSTNPSAFAAYFKGFTYVEGNFAVSGNKSAAVMHPDGTRRLLYCVESPEAWFDDYGAGKLVAGKADIKLDAEFMALVHSDDYRVFLTAEGDCNGLYATAKTPGGFGVRELRAGTGSVAFSWRVVARRKDNPGKRLEKLNVPKFNLPDPDKLPDPTKLSAQVVPPPPPARPKKP